jgi:hypothetical protein
MKKLLMAAVFAGTVAGFGIATTQPAAARDAFSFSFNTGDVAIAYSDGYWDNNRRWHKWRNAREAREYRARYRDRYYHDRRDRFANQGWRDQDRDGVPNRYDRDRDGDGVPNRADRRPGNPYR